MKYVCTVCGYVYDEAKEKIPFAELPSAWVCPLCGAPKAVFKEQPDEKAQSAAEKKSISKKYVCSVCGYVYDEAKEKIPFAELPSAWVCPLCGAPKAVFKEQTDEKPAVSARSDIKSYRPSDGGELTALGAGELSSLFSNLARGCEKQYQEEAKNCFRQIADYFESAVPEEKNADFKRLAELIHKDLDDNYKTLRAAAEENADRGALRNIVWGEKVTRMAQALIDRYLSEGDAFLNNTGMYICTVCGFLYLGDKPPELCPVCKVPAWKFMKIEGRN